MKIHLHRFLDDAGLDIDPNHVLYIGKPLRQGQAGRIALALSFDVEVGCGLEAVPSAGNLCETGGGCK
jgi:hypothetical protein